MKKNYKIAAALMGLSLLATPVLMGCAGGAGGNGGSNGGNSTAKYEAVKTGDIQAPEYVVVGDEFNLDDYVTIDGGAGPKVFDAVVNTISEGVCTIEGHTVRVLKEGTVSIAITVSPNGPTDEDPLWKGKFSTKAISTLKAQYQEATKDITNQFMFYEIEEDEETGGAYAMEWKKNTSEYIWFGGWNRDSAGREIAGGIMRCGNGHTHFYDISYDGTEIIVDPAHKADLSLYYVAQDFALPFTAFDTKEEVDPETGAKEEYLFLDGSNPYLTEFLDYNLALGWADGYMTHSLLAYPITPFDDGETYWEFDVMVASTAKPTVTVGGIGFILSTKEDACKVKLVDDYIAAKTEPSALSYVEIPQAFDKMVTAKNFTATTEVKFQDYNSATRKTVDVVGDEWDNENAGFFNGGVETETVNEDSVVASYKHGATNELFGFYDDGGKVYGYEQDASGKFTTSAVDGLASVWAADSLLTGSALKADSSVYGNFRVDSREEDKNGITFTIAGADCADFLDSAFSISSVGRTVVSLIDNMTKNYKDELDGESFWGQTDVTLVVAPTYIEYSVEINWDSYDDKTDGSSHRIYLIVTTRISRIGTTAKNVLPEGVK